ncbi:MAG: adenylate/guanylate cyclase domain-containing protein [Alphaproteobacteria bacterium]
MSEPAPDTRQRHGIGAGFAAQNGEARRGRIPLNVALGLSIGGLLLLTLGAVLAVTLWGAGANTRALLSDKAALMLETAVSQIRAQLDPAAATADFIARRMEDGSLDIDDVDAIKQALLDGHAGLDQAEGIIFIRPDSTAIGVRKLASGGFGVGEFTVETPDFAFARDRLADAPATPQWGRPTWSAELQTSVLNVIRGVTVNGELAGAVGVAVTIQQFSAFLSALVESLGQNAFALYGDDLVLAHPYLAQPYDGLSPERPLPALVGFADPVLAHIWDGADQGPLGMIDFTGGGEGHTIKVFDTDYVFVYERLDGYSDRPIAVGSYFRVDDIGQEVQRLFSTGFIGLGITLLGIVAALIVAKKLARPFTRVANAASRVGELALDQIEALPRSRIREIDEQARAFNGMVRALRWLEIYVPRRLARRLLAATGGEVTSQQAEVSVMFTDISGFTSWSEGRDATEVASMLNRHFAMVGQAIEATGGTLDKFIGDGAMAFWGAPERQQDHAQRAWRTATLIADALAAQNRRLDGQAPPLQMRIGIHCGPVTVGNIGAPERMNYTIVGDTVNVCQRLEQMGRSVEREGPGAARATVIVISEAIARRLDERQQAALKPFGEVALRGRSEPIEAFQFVPPQ